MFSKTFIQGHNLTHYHIMLHFDAVKIYSCAKHNEKGQIACNKQFLLFSQCFLSYMVLIFHFQMSSAMCFNLDQSKILSSGNVLICLWHDLTSLRYDQIYLLHDLECFLKFYADFSSEWSARSLT